jgi:PAS domain S-box-containing protein
VVAVFWLRRLAAFDPALRRISDVTAFILIAAVACTTIAATIGVSALCAAGVQPWSRFPELWSDWWLGDALGALAFAPALLTAFHYAWSRRTALEALGWIAAALLLAHVVFGQVLGVSPHPIEFVVFPLAIAAAVRGGPGPTTWVVLTASIVAIWHTVNQAGPFAQPEAHYSLILLQAFTAVLGGTALLLAASVAERKFDVSSRVEAEAALRENRDVLTLAMRAGSMGAWSRNLRTNDVWWSRELEEIFGLNPGDFARTEAGFFEFVHPDDRHNLRLAVDRAVKSASDYVIEFRFRHAHGDWRWMEGRGRATYSEDGSPLILYGIGADVTDRKRAEIALRDAKRAAESANQLKDQFLATLSHELRTPLNVVLGYARMLQTNSIAPEKRQRAIDVIERNAVAQHQLVEELLDMSRITSGKVRLEPTPVPVVTVLREAVDAIRPSAEAKRIAFETDIDMFAGSVQADTARLLQVFSNLLTNAVKFTGDGGRIHVGLQRKSSLVEIVVSDTGVGISPEFLPFVFEPFRQAEGKFDRVYAGLGLGLAITKQLVELHGGTIAASSPGLGQGATITMTLPCVEELAPVALEDVRAMRLPQAGSTTLDGSLRGLKVLLVDDEPDTLMMYREALESAGAQVQTASNGHAALQLADAYTPDLLVTDLGLPGMDGYELLRAFRTRPGTNKCPAVAVSAYARLEDRTRALAAGFQAHVAKPIDPAALVAMLRSAVSGKTSGVISRGESTPEAV